MYIFNRAWSVIHQIYKEEGWRGYFRGLTSTWAREIPGYYCFFFVYEATTRWLANPREQSVERLGVLKYVCHIYMYLMSEYFRGLLKGLTFPKR